MKKIVVEAVRTQIALPLYTSENAMVSGNTAPAHKVPSLPGMPHSHFIKSFSKICETLRQKACFLPTCVPSGKVQGRAKKPNGRFLRKLFRSSIKRCLAIPAILMNK